MRYLLWNQRTSKYACQVPPQAKEKIEFQDLNVNLF